jgi:formamidopyrimidine-DNA glycosylase
MPELPEVEVLARHLAPLIRGWTIREVNVRREKILAPTTVRELKKKLRGAKFVRLTRRGKYLLFTLRAPKQKAPLTLVGHLGMTGRMYLLSAAAPLPKHAAVVLGLGKAKFVFEDTRYFGRFTFDTSAIEKLGPEPLEKEFTVAAFAQTLKRSSQSIKVKLLDQSVVAGVGNIYASEALFRAKVSPRKPAQELSAEETKRLWRAIRAVLAEAIRCGSTVPLNFGGAGERDGLFYFGRPANALDYYEERLQVYDHAGKPCPKCGTAIRRLVQAARSTFYCPRCQRV